MNDFSRRILIPENVIFRPVQNEAVLLNLATQQYYALNEVGAHMFSLLTGSPSIDEAYARLVAEYAVDPVDLKADLQKLIDDLLAQGLIVLT